MDAAFHFAFIVRGHFKYFKLFKALRLSCDSWSIAPAMFAGLSVECQRSTKASLLIMAHPDSHAQVQANQRGEGTSCELFEKISQEMCCKDRVDEVDHCEPLDSHDVPSISTR